MASDLHELHALEVESINRRINRGLVAGSKATLVTMAKFVVGFVLVLWTTMLRVLKLGGDVLLVASTALTAHCPCYCYDLIGKSFDAIIQFHSINCQLVSIILDGCAL